MENQIKECFRILLTYYDKYYRKALAASGNPQKPFIKMEAQGTNAGQNIQLFLLHQKA